jgi:hypothetical protein
MQNTAVESRLNSLYNARDVCLRAEMDAFRKMMESAMPRIKSAAETALLKGDLKIRTDGTCYVDVDLPELDVRSVDQNPASKSHFGRLYYGGLDDLSHGETLKTVRELLARIISDHVRYKCGIECIEVTKVHTRNLSDIFHRRRSDLLSSKKGMLATVLLLGLPLLCVSHASKTTKVGHIDMAMRIYFKKVEPAAVGVAVVPVVPVGVAVVPVVPA